MSQNKTKYLEVFEDTQEIFTNLLAVSSLPNELNVILIGDSKAKKLFDVKKVSEVTKFRTHDDVHIIINEDVFDQLPPEYKVIVAEQAISYIGYDLEKDKLSITKPDFIEHSGIISKYGYDLITTVNESVKSIYDALKEQEEMGVA